MDYSYKNSLAIYYWLEKFVKSILLVLDICHGFDKVLH